MSHQVLFVRGLDNEAPFLDPSRMEKPEHVPDDWEIYNAPRPLYGHEHWKGHFRSGVFFVAIDPEGDYADEYREKTLQLDGHRCVFIDKSVIETWGRARAAHYNVDFDTFDFSEIIRSFMVNWSDGRINLEELI